MPKFAPRKPTQKYFCKCWATDTIHMYNGPMITQELLRALFEYREDGCLIRKITTNPRAPARGPSGSINKAGYLRTRVAGRLYYNHQLIWFMHHGTWAPALDHINGDRADNRIENLRICNQVQNMQNASRRKDNTTGVKGVSWRPSRNRYRARIVVDGKELCLGHFLTLEEAAKAVEEARLANHKEFARHE